MRDLHVLVVDDSAVNRKMIAEVLHSIPGVTSVQLASDGAEALRAIGQRSPDLITLDLEMPRLDGFKFLSLLMEKNAIPVVIVSGHSQHENVFRALELGALDFIAKPTNVDGSAEDQLRQQLGEKVHLVRHLSPDAIQPRRSTPPGLRGSETDNKPSRLPPKAERPDRVVVVGSSTGGPGVLVDIFRRFKSNVDAAIVIAQHMPPRFTTTFAERLNRMGRVHVHEVSGFELLARGHAYLCPGGYCIELVHSAGGSAVRVVDPRPEDRYVPSVNRLFLSAASVVGANTLAVVLTGMGDDGAAGVEAIKDAGGSVLVQSPESAVLSGMPKAAASTGSVDLALPIKEIPTELYRRLKDLQSE